MKQILSLVFAAFLMASCQSSTDGGTTNTSSEQVNADMPTVNPAHGQPYHDCSIAVGAPLAGQEGPAASSAKLNPAHGQPGHRCDIAVGAPLS